MKMQVLLVNNGSKMQGVSGITMVNISGITMLRQYNVLLTMICVTGLKMIQAR